MEKVQFNENSDHRSNENDGDEEAAMTTSQKQRREYLAKHMSKYKSRMSITTPETILEIKELEALCGDDDDGDDDEVNHNDKDNDHNDGHGHGHHGQRISFYYAPIQSQRWGEDLVLPHVNWGDLFFDLFYVAAAYNLGTLLMSALTPSTWFRCVIYYISIFGAIFRIWESQLKYYARYTVVDYFHRFVEVIRILLLSLVVLNTKSFRQMTNPVNTEMFLLSLGLFLGVVLNIALKVELILFGKGNRKAIVSHSKRKICQNYLPTAILYLAAVIVSGIQHYDAMSSSSDSYHRRVAAATGSTGDYSSKPSDGGSNNPGGWNVNDIPIILIFAAWIFTTFADIIKKKFIEPMCIKRGKIELTTYTIPLNVEYMIHRYGEWVMEMLGESILSLLIVKTAPTGDYYSIVFLGLLTMIVIQYINYASQPHTAQDHALWRNSTSSWIYCLFTQFYSWALVAFGVSYKIFLKSRSNDYQGNFDTGCDADKSRELLLVADDEETIQSLWDHVIRKLGGESGYEKMHIYAKVLLFSYSLAWVLFTLEVLVWSHHSFKENMQVFLRKKRSDDDDVGVGGSCCRRIRWLIVVLNALEVIAIIITFNLPSIVEDLCTLWHITLAGFIMALVFATTISFESNHTLSHHDDNNTHHKEEEEKEDSSSEELENTAHHEDLPSDIVTNEGSTEMN